MPLIYLNLNLDEVYPVAKQDLQSVKPESSEDFPVQLSPRSRSFTLLFEGQEAMHVGHPKSEMKSNESETFPVKDCIFSLFFISSTKPAKTEVAKPLTMIYKCVYNESPSKAT